MLKRLVPVLAALLVATTVGGFAMSSTPASAGPQWGAHGGGKAEGRTEARTQALVAALERKDLEAVTALIHEQATLTVPLSFSGAPEPAGRFVGKEQVLGYVQGVFTNMAVVDFADVRITVTDNGKTSFVQAKGQFTVADGRPYHNVYVFRYDWQHGRVISIEEYANPVTYCATFDNPDC